MQLPVRRGILCSMLSWIRRAARHFPLHCRARVLHKSGLVLRLNFIPRSIATPCFNGCVITCQVRCCVWRCNGYVRSRLMRQLPIHCLVRWACCKRVIRLIVFVTWPALSIIHETGCPMPMYSATFRHCPMSHRVWIRIALLHC